MLDSRQTYEISPPGFGCWNWRNNYPWGGGVVTEEGEAGMELVRAL